MTQVLIYFLTNQTNFLMISYSTYMMLDSSLNAHKMNYNWIPKKKKNLTKKNINKQKPEFQVLVKGN